MHPDVMLLRNRAPNGANDGVEVRSRPPVALAAVGHIARFAVATLLLELIAALDFGGDYQAFVVGDVDRKSDAAARPYRLMALFDRQFDVAGVKVAPVDDDQDPSDGR